MSPEKQNLSLAQIEGCPGSKTNYLADANAMRRVLAVVPEDFRAVIIYKLSGYLDFHIYTDCQCSWLLLTAPLDKIAESVIKAYGRWEGE